MSIIKTVSEQDLYSFWDKVTTPINWANASFDPANLNEFISPFIVPISDDREIFGSTNPYKEISFWQVNIHIRTGQGTGRAYELYNILEDRYREKTISDVTYDILSPSVIFPDDNTDFIVLPFRIRAQVFK